MVWISCPSIGNLSHLWQIYPPISLLFVSTLDRVRILQHLRELALLRLQFRVPADVLLVDENVGDGALVRHLLEGVLDRGAIICFIRVRMSSGGEDW